jgi:hypothetical protein
MIPIPDNVLEAVMEAEKERVKNPVKTTEKEVNKPHKASKKVTQAEIQKQVIKVLESAPEPMSVRGLSKEIEVLKKINNGILEYGNKTGDGVDIESIFNRTISKINYLAREIERGYHINKICKPTLIRPNTFVAKVVGNEFLYVDNYDLLSELISNIDPLDVMQEHYYYGHDKQFYDVFKAPLPLGYVASVCVVAVSDLSEQLYIDGKVKITPKNIDNRFEVEPTCEEQSPLLTDEPDMEFYHSITIKVLRKDMTIKSWMPGVHPNHRRYNNIHDHMVIIGKGWNN